ncbi:hypothetical protein EDD18DRAFT_1355176 [Armillaria luteobubalina]|uniref:Uncharacterized protein n=1 Tax=Armillaria luteobubalina TaxID=153913 RepID=A0AA39ULM9_9AGAR|nr:hypothetical protein EDD18DRAFT_1355176 [Armillaria luteobubalina]
MSLVSGGGLTSNSVPPLECHSRLALWIHAKEGSSRVETSPIMGYVDFSFVPHIVSPWNIVVLLFFGLCNENQSSQGNNAHLLQFPGCRNSSIVRAAIFKEENSFDKVINVVSMDTARRCDHYLLATFPRMRVPCNSFAGSSPLSWGQDGQPYAKSYPTLIDSQAPALTYVT